MESKALQLQPGDVLHCCVGDVRVENFIAAGGQGEVYRVTLNGRSYALKYYQKTSCTQALKNNLQELISRPISSPYFVWPLYLVENGDRFGYVMDLLPDGYHNVCDWLDGEVCIAFEVLIKICVEICAAFSLLHINNYCYKDISLSNIVFHPQTGKVQIIDNDNITKTGKKVGVDGTPEFIAPELVKYPDKAPTHWTDCHALALLLFHLLYKQHPFKGKKELDLAAAGVPEEQMSQKLYCPDTACFIFKDEADLNRYIPLDEEEETIWEETRGNWEETPPYLQKAFRSAFVEGAQHPHSRPSANKWAHLFIRFFGEIYYCACGDLHFYKREDFFDPYRRVMVMPVCPTCGQQMSVARMKIGVDQDKKPVVAALTHGGILCEGSFLPDSKTPMEPLLEVELIGGKLRLKNLSDHTVECHGIGVRKGEYTQYIHSPGEPIWVNGREYEIKL